MKRYTVHLEVGIISSKQVKKFNNAFETIVCKRRKYFYGCSIGNKTLISLSLWLYKMFTLSTQANKQLSSKQTRSPTLQYLDFNCE